MALSVAHILAESGLLEASTADAYVARARQSGVRVVDLLARERVASGEEIVRCVSSALNMPPILLTQIRIQGYIAKILSQADAERLLAIPVSVKREGEQDVLFVAVADPCAPGLLDELEQLTKRAVKLAVAAPDDIRHAIERTYGRRSLRAEVPSSSASGTPPLPVPEEDLVPFAALDEAPPRDKSALNISDAIDLGELAFDPDDIVDTASGVFELNTSRIASIAADERRSSAPIVEAEALVPKKGEWIHSDSDFSDLHIGEASEPRLRAQEAVPVQTEVFEKPLPAQAPRPSVLLEDALNDLELEIPEAPAFSAHASGLTKAVTPVEKVSAPLIEKLEAEVRRPPAPAKEEPAAESEWSLNINALLSSRPTPVETPVVSPAGPPLASVMDELDRLLDASSAMEAAAPTLDDSSMFDVPKQKEPDRASGELLTQRLEAERRQAAEADEDDDDELHFIHDYFVGRVAADDPRRRQFPRALQALEGAMAQHPDLDEAGFIDAYFSS